MVHLQELQLFRTDPGTSSRGGARWRRWSSFKPPPLLPQLPPVMWLWPVTWRQKSIDSPGRSHPAEGDKHFWHFSTHALTFRCFGVGNSAGKNEWSVKLQSYSLRLYLPDDPKWKGAVWLWTNCCRVDTTAMWSVAAVMICYDLWMLRFASHQGVVELEGTNVVSGNVGSRQWFWYLSHDAAFICSKNTKHRGSARFLHRREEMQQVRAQISLTKS